MKIQENKYTASMEIYQSILGSNYKENVINFEYSRNDSLVFQSALNLH